MLAMGEKIVFRVHALRRMFERAITVDEVETVIKRGEVIEDYPDDTPYPSQLVLGWNVTRPLHVVLARNMSENELVVVTVYEPDPAQWESGFRRRKT